jgi:hypothetical protein
LKDLASETWESTDPVGEIRAPSFNAAAKSGRIPDREKTRKNTPKTRCFLPANGRLFRSNLPGLGSKAD